MTGLIQGSWLLPPDRSTQTAEAYIRESITHPNAFVVPGFPSPSPMPPGLVAGQDLNDLVAFLLTQR